MSTLYCCRQRQKDFFIKMTFNCHEGKLIYVIASSSETFKHQTLVQEVPPDGKKCSLSPSWSEAGREGGATAE